MNEIKVTIRDSKGNSFSKFWKGHANRISVVKWTIENEDVPHYLDVKELVEITITQEDEK